MHRNLYIIYDNTAETCVGEIIFTAANDKLAVRQFREIIISGDQNNTISKYPEDHILMRIGTQDRRSAEITPEVPDSIATGKEILADEERTKAAQTRKNTEEA